MNAPTAGLARAAEELADLLGRENVQTRPDQRAAYGRDETEEFVFLPELVALPATTGEVAEVVRIAYRNGLPITPRGGGTGLSGGALPVRGGLVLGLERLDQVLTIDEANQTATVSAGVLTADLHRAAQARSLFYPPDPASSENCTLGGNLAEDAAGPRSCKYGTTRSYVLGLKFVTADGEIHETGGPNRKDAAGYPLGQLLIGSEGTLAIVTQAHLRLLPEPPVTLSVAFSFGSVRNAALAVQTICQTHQPVACELVDRRALELVARLATLPTELSEAQAAVFLAFDGAELDPLLEECRRLDLSLEGLATGPGVLALDARDQRRLWSIRRSVATAVRQHSPYKEVDTVVPRSKLAELVEIAQATASRHGLDAACYGHAADGNLHVNLIRGALDDERWGPQRDAAEEELLRGAVALDGSITGEHGIGWTQRRYLRHRHSPQYVELLRRIKVAFDPHGLLNPGKIFPSS